ncbi:MAG TPA: hypothetical protein VMH86_01285 [Rhizomicrobium sp.]|nr:hypothetical protein [Rhizomicrobium sp.]
MSVRATPAGAILAAVFALLALAPSAAGAASLRGVVVSAPALLGQVRVGRPGVTVTLTGAAGRPSWQTVTTGSGYYFFMGVAPGSYVLQVGSARYGVTVTSAAMQDIPPVVLK